MPLFAGIWSKYRKDVYFCGLIQAKVARSKPLWHKQLWEHDKGINSVKSFV